MIELTLLAYYTKEFKKNESNNSTVLVKKISLKAIKYLKDQKINKNLWLIILNEISYVIVQKLGQLSLLFKIGMKK